MTKCGIKTQKNVSTKTIMPRRVPLPRVLAPYLPETEQAVLGACIRHSETYATAAKMIADNAVFHEEEHRRLWACLGRWYAENSAPPDGAAMVALLEAEGLPLNLGGDCVVAACLPYCLDRHCRQLLTMWALRRVRDDAATLARCCDARDLVGLMETLRSIGVTVRAAGLIREGAK